jgi:hypothetical protein
MRKANCRTLPVNAPAAPGVPCANARRRQPPALGSRHPSPAPRPMKEDHERTRRDIRAAVIFGVIAATIEMGVLLWFLR